HCGFCARQHVSGLVAFAPYARWNARTSDASSLICLLSCRPVNCLRLTTTFMIRLQTLRAELRPTIRLALPLVLAELGWMSMGIVDTVMVGHLPDSATAMGAVSLSSNIFIVLAL